VGYDLVAAYNILRPANVTADEFWAKVTPSIWQDMPMREETHWLLGMCASHVGRENVFICTKCLSGPMQYAAKVQWIYDHLPQWLHYQIQINGQKETNARPGALLIDDSDYNVDMFKATRGGHAILVPRPWNSNKGLPAMAYVEKMVRLYCQEMP
jgi:5'(3')-deoxyribonucleotidase